MKTFEASRPGVAAMAVGVGRAAVEFATEYARTRVQFGKPVGANQGVAFQLADMAAAVDAARLPTRDYPVERWHRDAKILRSSRARRRSSGC